jgi:hypothetical protein
MQQTALRETYKETGHKVQLLPLILSTCATSLNLPVDDGSASDNHEPHAVLCTEPVAVQQRLTRQAKRKIVFWFATQGNSSQKPDEDAQLDYEKIDAI